MKKTRLHSDLHFAQPGVELERRAESTGSATAPTRLWVLAELPATGRSAR